MKQLYKSPKVERLLSTYGSLTKPCPNTKKSGNFISKPYKKPYWITALK